MPHFREKLYFFSEKIYINVEEDDLLDYDEDIYMVNTISFPHLQKMVDTMVGYVYVGEGVMLDSTQHLLD